MKHEKAARVRRSRIISWLEFIEAPVFTRLLPKYLTDDEYRELQLHLARSPDAGDVLQGTGGFRKVRWTDRRRGQGKRGGLRVIYYYFEAEMQIWLLTVYDKDEAVNLTPGERRSLKEAMAEEKRQRAARRTRRRN